MTYPTSTLERPFSVAFERRALNPGPVGVAVAALALGALYPNAAVRWGQGALFLVGGAAGVVLYPPPFGVTSAWGVLIAGGRGSGLRARVAVLGGPGLWF